MVKRRSRTTLRKEAFDALRQITMSVDGLGTIDDLEDIRYVPTRFSSFNRAIVLGGTPMGAFCIIHGPSAIGKTSMGVALLSSFLDAGNIPVVFDAERTFSRAQKWIECLGLDGKVAYHKPWTLDEMRLKMNKVLDAQEKLRKKEKISKEVSVVFLIDTLNRLQPKSVMDVIEKEGIDKAYPMQAFWLSTWFTEIMPRLDDLDAVILAVFQERKKLDAKKFERQYRVKGGESILYEACVRIRVAYSKSIKLQKGGEKIEVGQEHHFIVEKNKVGHPNQRGMFCTANGLEKNVPEGFDFVREILAEAEHRKMIQKAKDKKGRIREGVFEFDILSSLMKDGLEEFQGREGLRQVLRDDEGLLDKLRRYLDKDIPDWFERSVI